jgi:hypothetical protein
MVLVSSGCAVASRVASRREAGCFFSYPVGEGDRQLGTLRPHDLRVPASADLRGTTGPNWDAASGMPTIGI